MKYYAGVGSRETPQDVLETMWKIGKHLADKGYTLRSGGARACLARKEIALIIK